MLSHFSRFGTIATARTSSTVLGRSTVKFLQPQTRSLGTAKRGPPLTDLVAQWKAAKGFFFNPAITYVNLKYQCDGVRLFSFLLFSGYLCCDLILNPPKSSYFATWGITYWPSNLMGIFRKTSGELFHSEPVEYKGIVPCEAYQQLISKRRLDSDVAED